MPARDDTAWTPVQGDHGDDVSYQRLRKAPGEQPTDEQRTAAEIEGYEDAAESSEYDATTGALEAAQELGVDLSTVTGTGADGRITKADVEAAAGD